MHVLFGKEEKRSAFSLITLRETVHSFHKTLVSNDSFQQDEECAKEICACLDYVSHSFSVFLVKSYVWGNEKHSGAVNLIQMRRQR